jgi:hypothetical protein
MARQWFKVRKHPFERLRFGRIHFELELEEFEQLRGGGGFDVWIKWRWSFVEPAGKGRGRRKARKETERDYSLKRLHFRVQL